MLFILCCGCKNAGEANKNSVEGVQHSQNLLKQDQVRLFDGETFENWEITNFGPQGHVYVSGGEIFLNMGDGCTGINWTQDFPKANYEIELEAKRTVGHDFFCGLTFPVNDTYCSLIVGGWGGVVVGLSTIDGKDGGENETTKMRSFNTDEWYKVRLKVTPTKIEAWINADKEVDFTHEGRTLNIRPEVGLSRPLGISTWKTSAALRNIYLREF